MQLWLLLVLTGLLLENGDVLIDCLCLGFFSWEQENEERQPSKGHFSGDQEMILQIYGLQGKKRRVGSSIVCSPAVRSYLSESCLLKILTVVTFTYLSVLILSTTGAEM